MGIEPLGDLALDAVESSAADEEDVLRIHVDVLLVGMLTPALRRDIDHRALEQLEQSLLHTLSAHVAGDAGIVALAGNFIYLIDKHDAAFSRLYVVVGHLEQAAQNALHVLAHVAGLGKHRGVDDGERHVEQPGDGAGQQCLARAGGAHHDDVTLLNLHAIVILGLLQPLVVVVHGHGQIAFGLILPDDILVQIALNLFGLGHFFLGSVRLLGVFALGFAPQHAALLHNIVGLRGAVLTDIAVQSGDEQPYLVFVSSAERTNFLCHCFFLLL